MPLVNTSKINEPRYYCTRGGSDDTNQHPEGGKRISKREWDQDGMCSHCAEYLWAEISESFRNQ